MKVKGFTLVEVMLSAAIMVGVLVGILSLFFYCFNLQETSKNKSSALFQMRGKLEELRSMSFSNLKAFITPPNNDYYQKDNIMAFNGNDVVYYYQESPLNGIGQGGVIRIEVAPLPGQDFSASRILDIRAIAGWRQKGGKTLGEIYDAGGIFKFSDDPANLGNGDGMLGFAAALTTAVADSGL